MSLQLFFYATQIRVESTPLSSKPCLQCIGGRCLPKFGPPTVLILRGDWSSSLGSTPALERAATHKRNSLALSEGTRKRKRNHGGRCGSQQDLRVQGGECPLCSRSPPLYAVVGALLVLYREMDDVLLPSCAAQILARTPRNSRVSHSRSMESLP